jgi:copper resistance protein B
LSPLLAVALLAAAEEPAHEDMGHHDRTFTVTMVEELDYARVEREDVVNWEAQGWVGGDKHKFWWKTEGETEGSDVAAAEVQALYSRNVWTFFDAQVGVRFDLEPDRRGYVVAGVQGLAPGFLETELHAFIGFEGDVSLRLHQSFDLRMTNRLVLQPMFETDFYLTDARKRLIDVGFATLETGVFARYEIARKFAPYVAAVYERRLGGSARLARTAGQDVGGWSLRSGVRFWF